MRSLIRPALFMIVRLGLFLAVAAWVVGQSWYMESAVGGAGYLAAVLVLPEEMIVHVTKSASKWTAKAELWPRNAPSDVNMESLIEDNKRHPDDCWVLNPLRGVALIVYRPFNNGIAVVPHWVLVTTFALFYGVLKWVYRKRATEAVGDE